MRVRRQGVRDDRCARLAAGFRALALRLPEEPEAARGLIRILPDVAQTRRAVEERFARTGEVGLKALGGALGEFEAAIRRASLAPVEAAPSRAAERRSRLRGERLECSAQGLLKKVARILAAATLGAAAIGQYAAAAPVIIDSPPSAPIQQNQNVDTTLNVTGPAVINPVGSGGVELSGIGSGGSNAQPQHYTCSIAGQCTITAALPRVAPTCAPTALGATCIAVPTPNSSWIASYNCSVVNGCLITTAVAPVPEGCSVNSGAPNGTNCILVPASGNPNSVGTGPALTVNVGAANQTLTLNTPVDYGVVVLSIGEGGHRGSTAYVAGNGGSGGWAADGGVAIANVYANINAATGPGVLATSLGGLGGDGGDAYGLGGSGGSGGAAGFATSAEAHLFAGRVVTQAGFGVAAIAQGGNGGRGGNGGGLFYSGGGGGTLAGSGGSAIATTAAGTSIETWGRDSHGVMASSVGGRGGGGGNAWGAFFSDTSSGGTGGNAKYVKVDNGADIVTHGPNSSAVYVQSVGGGGGDGGNAVAAGALGSSGGAGGYGGVVEAFNTGSLTTWGKASKGIYAQSVGGGGGNGGDSAGIGGLGGDGSGTTNGDKVTVVNSGRIQTAAEEAPGIFAQSIGGGGGNGGGSIGIWTSGGNGGSGGLSGVVTVVNSGDITTGMNGVASINSQGIFAQSVGGGGGNGGGAISASGSIASAMGGNGGSGNDGAAVHVELDDNLHPALATGYNILTQGDHSAGVFAQSVGGGGGNGGFAVAASAGVLSYAFAKGGAAGSAGNADTVDVSVKGSITTYGQDSFGVFAQSVGGGGGTGGYAVAATAGGGGAALSMGGSGGSGGTAKAVTLNSWADVSTAGSNSAALFAQSIGGGGGNGGFAVSGSAGLAALTGAIGGSGSGGGASGRVDLLSSGFIFTSGENSAGIQAQSIGGGGGNGGFAVSAALGAAGAASLAVGGGGGTGYAAGDVVVNADGGGHFAPLDPQTGHGTSWNLVTNNTNSIGIFAQSVGGGGGNGGFAGSLAIGGAAAAGVGIGGNAASGADGGLVTVNSGNATFQNNILTFGAGASGILAQSVGGGGGNGGFAVVLSGSGSIGPAGGAAAVGIGGTGGSAGDARKAEVTSIGAIQTNGDQADGVIVQSVGGGGGNGGFSAAGSISSGIAASVAIGGRGATGGAGDIAKLTSTGDIQTFGQQSVGLFAQSVGGGGGNGGFALSASAASIGGAGVSLGGGAGNGGTAKDALIGSTGNVTTWGALAPAIMAQSVGGSGGNGGFSIGIGGGGQIGGAGVALGGKGGKGATSGDARVDSTGAIQTEGDQSFGIIAQSLGGGGGSGGFAASGAISGGNGGAVSVAMGGDGGEGAHAGAAHIGNTGDVFTSGAGSVGLFAQSLGGGGGNGGFSGALAIANNNAYEASIGGGGGKGNYAGAVDITSRGSISTSGDSAIGIQAQSIGGGGGAGGFSISLDATNKGQSIGGKLQGAGLNIPNGPQAGQGGDGGYGGSVQVNSYGLVGTFGSLAHGIFAQSVGGGGGSGGFAAGAGLSVKGGATMNAVGGAGGAGNYAGDVTVLADGSSTPLVIDPADPVFYLPDGTVARSGMVFSVGTFGAGSNAILAQSIGGGGGAGGFAVGGAFSAQGDASTKLDGGAGGSGNYAGKVDVTNIGGILTYGANANAILAQSVGGGGGVGGFTASVAGTGKDADASTQSVGGKGGVGNYAGDVSVDSTGDLLTAGDLSRGIFAQSVGGSGGAGGFAVAGALSINSGGAETNATGGDGGSGDYAGDVTVTSRGKIFTNGSGATGILAQSVGGGGGSGAFAGGLALADGDAASKTGGGAGGQGSDGHQVRVTVFGKIITLGAKAVGVIAQSIGGGGGDGGFAINVASSKSGKSSSDAIGGSGGDGGAGGKVILDNNAQIATAGVLSHGLFAQSVGGGGGAGGFAVSGGFSLAQDDGSAGVTSSAVGGGGGLGHDADSVTVTNTGAIVTGAAGTYGILAQSVGGGGGAGGFAGDLAISKSGEVVSSSLGGAGAGAGKGGIVTVANSASIVAAGDRAAGLFAQSVGGGGGVGGFSLGAAGGQAASAVNQAVGGSGGAGGGADKVIVHNLAGGDIATRGAMAYGLIAQSIGGGGGSGGFSISAALSLQSDSKSEVGGGASATGGSGGSAGDGGQVAVDNVASIVTDGVGATGLFAQSVGGGGGAGGFAGALAIDAGAAGAVSNAVGGAGGSAGKASSVDVSNTGKVQTAQANSIGILAQSVGGGGGQGGFAVGLGGSKAKSAAGAIGGDGGAAGDADKVSVTNGSGGQVVTLGDMSHGVLAQSVGGGGGAGGFVVGGSLSVDAQSDSKVGGGAGGTAGKAGDVTVANHGGVFAFGAGADGILAQSVGGGGGAGGFAASAGVSVKGGGLANSVGGAGAGGGNGARVDVLNDGVVQTSGANGIGVFAQSVGGGGGSGGFALGAAASQSDSVADTVGGAGGAAGAGGDVKVTNLAAGQIHTLGAMANGVQAQSVGGGGGNGGFVVGGSVSVKGDASSSVGGGAGGGGGAAGAVSVGNDGQIVTEGASAVGVFAQSVGGGGGSGGFAGGLAVGKGSAISQSVGGAGAIGGAAGKVDVVNTGVIHTWGAQSIGVLAQSVGGGGGKGGMSISGSGSSGDSTATSVGGSGAGGGSGGVVSVTNSGQIVTDGALSYGVFAQSVGGGGGAGGISVAGTLSSGGGGMTSSVGGSGAGGGDGGTVTVVNTGAIIAQGAGSTAVLAQSVGGGGGAGGFSGALRLSAGGDLDSTVGGKGGTGGSGGDVTVKSTGLIATLADDSIGVLAQSIGGGGGASAFALSAQLGAWDSARLGLGGGGSGAGGGHGKVVVDVSGGQIITRGALSYGVLIHSVAGGGGVAAISVPDPLSIGAGGIALTLGSTGAVTGDGADVTVTNSNPTFSSGAGSVGLIAQSIGGGGGIEGVSGDIDVIGSLISAAIGGTGTGGGSGGAAALSNSGQVVTTGDNAFGVLAQSIGGGGGDGSYSLGVATGQASGVSLLAGGAQGLAGDGKALSFPTFSGAVFTTGALATGVLAQSIGGGGGVSNFIAPTGVSIGAGGVSLKAGSTGGAGGAGGTITLATAGVVTTSGVGAVGVQAQSIGGGGGQVGFFSGDASRPLITAAGLGGAGVGGSGGAVALTIGKPVETTGAGSAGVLAQSIGGGGGTLFGSGAAAQGLILGGAAGDGGKITLVSSALIATKGVASPGLIVQSIGGGGGYGLDLSSAGSAQAFKTVGASAGGAGGSVDVNIKDKVLTAGAGSTGLIVQSLGGGGGLVGAGDHQTTLGVSGPFAGSAGGAGAGGAVSVKVGADVVAGGADASAILLQSAGGTGAGAISLDIAAASAVVGGTGIGAGVRLLDGSNNSLLNRGAIASMGLIDGWSIRAGKGGDSVDNFGQLWGSIDLDGGKDSLRNRQGGSIFSGLTLSLGGGEAVLNEGQLVPGGTGRVLTTALTGDFTQSPTGAYVIDLDFARTGQAGEADRLNISGAANVSGEVRLGVLNKARVLPGDHAVTILSAGAGAAHAGLGLNAPVSAIASFNLRYPDANTIQLGYLIDFSPAGLNRNQTSLGDHFNDLQLAGGSKAMDPVIEALFDIATTAALVDRYDRMSQEPYVQQLEATRQSGQAFTDRLFSCSAKGGEGQVTDGEDCAWARLDLRELRRRKTTQQLSFRDNATSVSGGVEKGLGDGWRIGAGFNYEQATTRTGTSIADATGDRVQGGAVIKKDSAWAELALAVTGGKASFDTTRRVGFTTPTVTAHATQSLSYGAVSFRAARTFEGATGWARPSLELVGARVHTDALHETGAGPLNLDLKARDQDYWLFRPSLELGHDQRLGKDTWLRTTVKGGLNQFISGRSSVLAASFEGAPSSVAPFLIRSAADATTGEVSVGVALVNAKGSSVRLGATGQYGATTRQHGVHLKGVLAF